MKFNFSDMIKTLINIILILVQLIFIIVIIIGLQEYGPYIKYSYWVLELLALFLVMHILNKKNRMTFKLSWTMFILIFPICGTIFYFMWGQVKFPKKLSSKLDHIKQDSQAFIKQDPKIIEDITDLDILKEIDLIQNLSGYPVYKNTRTKYLEVGEVFYTHLFEELFKAKKSIFIEFYIIADGELKTEIMNVLKQKAGEGVEVRILYDQIGSFFVLPKDFVHECKTHQIKCASINPLSVSLFCYLNYSDHRKIVVIDGNVAFTGGINIGDEYINTSSKLGHWKDMGVMLKGDAVWSFTVMFLRMWDYASDENSDFIKHKPTINYLESRGLVAPFGDGPDNQLDPAESNYIRIISSAKRYIYITTPYLVIDSDLSSALCIAAKSGVDVRIITPYIADKAVVQAETRSFYAELLEDGIRIFEYTPGFIHGKTIVSDDKVCVIGSINFDFRSLFWNFECGAYIYNDPTVIELKEDFLNTLALSKEISLKQWRRKNVFVKIYYGLLRIISPLA